MNSRVGALKNEIASSGFESKPSAISKQLLIKSPESLKDNENNHWVWSQAVLLKINGVDINEAISVIEGLRQKSSQAEESRNFTINLPYICKSIYKKPAYAAPNFPMPNYLASQCSRGTVNIRSNTGPPVRVAK